MKKVLISLMVIALAVGFAAAGSLAYFDDTETSTGNTFTAGTIDLEIDPATGVAVATIDGDLDLMPAMTGNITTTLHNAGTNPMDVWVKTLSVSCVGNVHPESEDDEDASDTINDIDGVIRYELQVDGGYKIDLSGNHTISDGTHQLVGDTAGIATYYIYLGAIASGNDMVVKQSYQMDKDTTDWAQGDKMTFDIEFFAQQQEPLSDPPPVPATELSGHGR